LTQGKINKALQLNQATALIF